MSLVSCCGAWEGLLPLVQPYRGARVTRSSAVGSQVSRALSKGGPQPVVAGSLGVLHHSAAGGLGILIKKSIFFKFIFIYF